MVSSWTYKSVVVKHKSLCTGILQSRWWFRGLVGYQWLLAAVNHFVFVIFILHRVLQILMSNVRQTRASTCILMTCCLGAPRVGCFLPCIYKKGAISNWKSIGIYYDSRLHKQILLMLYVLTSPLIASLSCFSYVVSVTPCVDESVISFYL